MNKGGPPTVQITNDEAIVWFDGNETYRIKWSDVTEISISINVIEELEYSEAFWMLNSGEFGAPLDMVVGADELREKLISFRGFDQEKYQEAILAESQGEQGYFICWRNS